MIKITEDLTLKNILLSDAEVLYTLMKTVYPSAYSHFWKDKGDWYVNSQYSKENLEQELLQENSSYYFICCKNEVVGNIRIIWDENLEGLSEEKQVKLHRLYLHKKTQGKGFGKKIVNWLENLAIQKEYAILWLDAMNMQEQAFQFYKKLGYKYHSHTFLPFELLQDDVRKMSQVYKLL
ncbi:GNAT family N-acetyltransferase [Polaribacter sp. KT 15]|uniref:GNAT family N-acetyltransferase n=1 Tax=Polaribacter sp. KT 15 TaxID=1896175 RepID=UPI00090CC802|nr:GNAT family N-acetyltransferase [Polaribacter sp. KT 15]SHM92607.1 Acetyltransferase (GNAT) domain-containing protein [Polaribacter sp. KT 15]